MWAAWLDPRSQAEKPLFEPWKNLIERAEVIPGLNAPDFIDIFTIY